jgi:hypothetical protein
MPGTLAMKEDDLDFVNSALLRDSPGRLLNIADSLLRVSTFYGACGQMKLLDGDVKGWMEIHRAWLYRLLGLKISISEFNKSRLLGEFRPVRSLEVEANGVALCLMYALAVSNDPAANFLYDSVVSMLVDSGVVPERYWKNRFLEPFSARLYLLSKNRVLTDENVSKRGLGPYLRAIEAWERPDEIQQALAGICDYHCQRLRGESHDFCEFEHPPFDLVAPEVMAMVRVRHSLGLSTPPLEHPLVAGTFSAPVGNPTEIDDPLLEKVEALL